jgi:phosphoesterase RecJ-like protein
MGKQVTLFCSTDVPYNLKFLAGLNRLVHELPTGAAFDATTVCDVGASHRIGPGLPPRERLGTYLNIDHHLTSDDFGDLNYVDADAASVGVMIHRILGAMKHKLSRPVAEALYVSVLSDTGSFRYSSTNPEALRVAADLVEAGADPWTISSAIYEQQPVERIRLLRDVLGTLEVSQDGHFASLVVTQAMKAAAHARPELTDGFINFARSIQGVEVAAQLTEPTHEGGPWSLSFRSRGQVNVAQVAQRFGGGGHRNAAGASLHGTLEEVRAQVARAVADELKASP